MKITETYFASENETTIKGTNQTRTVVNTGNVSTNNDADVDVAMEEANRIASGLNGRVVKVTEKRLAQFGLSTKGLEQAFVVSVGNHVKAIVGTWREAD